MWEPLVTPDLVLLLLDGLLTTLRVALVVRRRCRCSSAALFGVARLSDHRGCSLAGRAGRGVLPRCAGADDDLPFGFVYGSTHRRRSGALVIALTLYNGSVLAEVFRAGIIAVPRGQSEAAYAIGMRKSQVMTQVLLPQAVRIMLPAIVSQCVVVVKDTALGFALPLDEFAYAGRSIRLTFENPIQTYVVIAAVYILINWSLSRLAGWLEARQRRSGGKVVHLTTDGAET